MNKKNLIIAGVLIVIAVALFLIPRFFRPSATTTNPTNSAPVTTQPTTLQSAFPLDDATVQALNAQAQNEFNFALTKAKEWRGDVAPVAMIAKYTGAIDVGTGKDTFVFVSPTLSQYYYALTLDQAKNANGENNFERILYFKEDYFLPINTAVLPLSYWKLSYLDALKKADDLGGKDIRTANKNYDVNLVLSAQQGSYLMWDVEYMVNSSKIFSVSINAFDGTVK